MHPRLTIENGLQALANVEEPFVTVFHHGSLDVEIYKPEKVDHQQPHDRDELYVIVSGSGYFICGEQRQPFEKGEVLFAAAGVPHRFEDFTDDFVTWVFFYGPKGGEVKNL